MKVLSYIISLIFLWSTGAMAFAPGFLQVAGGGDSNTVSPFFSADWSTNTPGGSDILCSTAAGCPGIFDQISGTSIYSVVDGTLTATVTTDGDFGNILLDDDLGEVLYSIGDEYWIEFQIKFSMISGYQSDYMVIGQVTHDAPSIRVPQWRVNAPTGTINQIEIQYNSDSSVSTLCSSSWSPSSDTWYTWRIHYKKDTDTGDTANNGQQHFKIVETSTFCSKTDIDSDQLDPPARIGLGLIKAGYSSTSHTIKWDNFKVYTSDPGWSW